MIDDQIRYYRGRAAEYDATSSPPDDPFVAETERIRAALRAFAPRGRVLELAAGTGQWTGLLAEYATELAVVDASPEMLKINAEKHSRPNLRFVQSDVFALKPAAVWDVVFSVSGCRTCRRADGRGSGTSWPACFGPMGESSSSMRRTTACGTRTGWTGPAVWSVAV